MDAAVELNRLELRLANALSGASDAGGVPLRELAPVLEQLRELKGRVLNAGNAQYAAPRGSLCSCPECAVYRARAS